MYVVNGYIHIIFKKIIYIFVHGRAELDAAGFIRAEENDKRTHIKKFAENFIFFVKIRHIKYIKQKKIILRKEAGIIWQKTLPRLLL